MVQHEVSLSAFDSHWPAMRYLSTKAGVDHAFVGIIAFGNTQDELVVQPGV